MNLVKDVFWRWEPYCMDDLPDQKYSGLFPIFVSQTKSLEILQIGQESLTSRGIRLVN